MKTIAFRLATVTCVAAFGAVAPALSHAQKTKDFDCGKPAGKTLQSAIEALEPGDTLAVRGNCTENVLIHAGIRSVTIDGGGTATLNGASGSSPTIQVRGKDVTLKGLRVSGGQHGIAIFRGGTGIVDACHLSGAAVHGVSISGNSWGRVVASTIEGNGGYGISVNEHASSEIGFRGDFAAQVSPNTIRNNAQAGIIVVDSSYAEIQGNVVTGNGRDGILVSDNSSARIGAQTGVAGSLQNGNTIEANGRAGITVARSANARIVGNRIVNNVGDGFGGSSSSHGVSLIRAAQADIADNEISGNGGHGISIWQNSAANLGSDGGSAASDQPNRTTANNGRQGVYCGLNSIVDGRLGTMIGNNGQKFVETGCVDSLQ